MRAHAPVRNPLASFVSVTPGYPRPCRKAVRPARAAGLTPPASQRLPHMYREGYPAPAAKPSASLPQESLRLSATRGWGAALSLPLPVPI